MARATLNLQYETDTPLIKSIRIHKHYMKLVFNIRVNVHILVSVGLLNADLFSCSFGWHRFDEITQHNCINYLILITVHTNIT